MFHGSLFTRCCICDQSQNDCVTSVTAPGKSICHNCNEDAKSIINLARKLEDVGSGNNKGINGPFVDVSKKISGVIKKIIFMSESLLAFKHQIQSDVELKPGCNGPSRPAHRALLAAQSEIFKNMLDSDDVKAQSDTITLAELNAEELESLVDFLYLGSLPKEKLEKHILSLFTAAHKYEISYLEEICASHLLASMSKANAFDILEVSDSCANTPLKKASLSYIIRNMEDFVFSDKYQSFVLKNPILCMEVTRAFFAKKKNVGENSVNFSFHLPAR